MDTQPKPPPPLEVWGGIESTVNRVGDHFFDQVARSGHVARIADLDLIADLGVRALRYPVLWEWAATDHPSDFRWAWADERLPRLRELGVRPIVGLVHHGSGPRHTSLLDDDFATGLAEYAGRLAERFPWVEDYTPVNEPLTTARFSGLYGHWYPHGRDARTFARALLVQCRAVALAMRAIRKVRPDARLVQTEDLGKTQGTPALRCQVDFENERRWLSFDMLRGRVDPGHPMWGYLRWAGVPEGDMGWFLDNPCPPDIIGVNHYITSERFLDDRLNRYPPHTHGGNGRQAYADVEAVRVGPVAGPAGVLRETWLRYGRPIAVTEAHLGCTREEQMRWLLEVWHAAGAARREGIDIRAVTVWSLLGAYDWNSLVTRPDGHYEPGVFDLRGPSPRPTALVGLVRELASGAEPAHPVLGSPGWWHRPERLCYPHGREGVPHSPPPSAEARDRRPVLIAGTCGALGRTFARLCAARGLPHRLSTCGDLDIADPASVAAALAECRPWAIVNAAGFSRVDDAERERHRCRRENALGPAVLASACVRRGVRLLTFSSDLVFDGTRREAYREGDAVNPLGFYGETKVRAERAVRRLFPAALVVRSGTPFGPWDESDFLSRCLRALASGEPVVAANDLTVSPTYLPDLVHACLDLLIDGEQGVWHLANPGEVTWAELARAAARGAGLDEAGVEGRPASAFGWTARRPAYSALGSERGLLLPPLDDALGRFLGQRPPPPRPRVGSGLALVVANPCPVAVG